MNILNNKISVLNISFFRCAMIVANFTMLIVFGISCSKEDIIPPNPPLLIPHGDDADSIEIGIDAVPEGNWIYLEWKENTENDLSGYIIYRDIDPLPDFSIITTLVTDTFFLDQQVTLGTPYYYTVTAVDTAGNESLGGDTLDYTLTSKATLLFPVDEDTLSPGTVIFQWELVEATNGFFIVKIFDKVVGKWVLGSEIDVLGFEPQYADTLFLPSGSYKWKVEYWGNDKKSGSESLWRNLVAQ